ncbi:MFS transporter [Croceicoccus estronivorus]|uniref:MFS transporter n=1 Tax=Croceicoccus estronivorus TaxID=1172626 RepID=UPI00082EB90C|nr:MFS transporter [Croceicoccus estronivorus]OCC22591.1 MFS transporter [Croceicoccus estronivorus]
MTAEATGDERLTRRHVVILVLLASIVMFEGFDISATSVVLPYLSAEFGTPTERLGDALAVIALGSMGAWILLRLADRFGRRPMLLLAAAGFSLGSLITVLSTGVASYTGIQFVTRALLVSQVALAYMVASETLPPKLRGRANGLLGAMGSFGSALPFIAIGPALETALSWRLLFVIGAAPLLLMPLLFLYLRETPVWLAARARGLPRPSALDELKQLVAPGVRRSFIAMSLFWLIVNFASSTGGLFFTLYVVQERGWPASDFAHIAPFGLVGAFVGYLGAGLLSDAIGRRWTVCIFMALLGALTMTCYASTDWYAIAASFIGLQAMLGVWVIAYTLNSELFPTELRGAANGWCNNLIGRWGVVFAPAIVGNLSSKVGGIGPAASLLAAVAWLAIPLVLFMIPETRGRDLDRQAAT